MTEQKEDYEEISHSLDLNIIERIYNLTDRILGRNFEDITQEGELEHNSKSQLYVMPHKSHWDPLIFAFSYYSELEGDSILDNSVPEVPDPDDYSSNKQGLTFATGDDVMGDGRLKNLMNKLGCFGVKRNDNSNRTLRDLMDYMALQLEDYGLLIFPESHQAQDGKRTGRSFTGEVGSFTSLYLGAAEIAVKREKNELQIVPVDITYEELPDSYELEKRLKQDPSETLREKVRSNWKAFAAKKLPVHLTIGQSLNYTEDSDRKQLGPIIERKTLELIKPTPSNVVGQVALEKRQSHSDLDLEEEIEKIYQSLRKNGSDTSILDSKGMNLVLEEGRKLIEAEFGIENFNQQLAQLYGNQIKYLL